MMASSVVNDSINRTGSSSTILNNGSILGDNGGGINLHGESSIEELTKEVELLKQKLEEERAKFNDVECE